MQKILIRIGIIATVLFVGTLGVLWMLFVHAPSPEEVCQHKIDLTYAAAGEGAKDAAEQLVARLRESCVEGELRRIKLRGKIQYAERAKCVVASQDLDAAERC